MIPGSTTKLSESTLASAATIYPKTDLIRVTGSTQIDNIVPAFGGGFSGILLLLPVDGALTVSTTGNVVGGGSISALQNKVTMLVYSKSQSKWYTHALS
jgi:hypothetical protein